MIRTIIICFVSLLIVNTILAKLLKDECSIAKELKANGFPKPLLPDWVCLVKSESHGNTSAKSGPNKDGSYDFGLFQLNSRYWCKIGEKGGDCQINCNDLLSDSITNAAKCARMVYERHGFQAWDGWKNKCLGNPLPNLSKCK